jgi:uncharacterized NAD(P)/FAD-binding protein YdhS
MVATRGDRERPRLHVPRIAIVGGGYTGAAAAIQLTSASDADVVIVEPRAQPGCGVAYSTTDPDHRLNGPLDNHLVDPRRSSDLRDWCEKTRVLARDPQAIAANGVIYLRRGDFGGYVAHALAERSSRIRHRRCLATALRTNGRGYEILTSDSGTIEANAVVVATGTGGFRLPALFATLGSHTALVHDPFEAGRLQSIPATARVLLVGAGLTALDVLSTLLRQGHTEPILAISRHGIRPRAPRDRFDEAPVTALLAKIDGEVPDYVRRAVSLAGIRGLSRALRERIREAAAAGIDWQTPFDDVRNVVWQFWPALPLEEKSRFFRHLRGIYDAHRFRAPPQNDLIVREGERRGRVLFRRGRFEDATAAGDRIRMTWRDEMQHRTTADFDHVINCTGLDPMFGAGDNPFLRDLMRNGFLRAEPTGFGFDVDSECRPIRRDGSASARLRVVGPPTAGSRGDPLGVIFIAPQIRRMVPGLLAEVGASIKYL